MLFGVQIHALVVMNNHFHLIITTPNEDLGQVMQYFIGSITRTLNLISGRSGRVFGTRYHQSLINSTPYFSHVLKYVYRNPVRAGVCEAVEEYPYSTLQGLLGRSWLSFPIHYPFGLGGYYLIPDQTDAFLDWLNHPFKKEHEELIRKGLKRTEFQPPKKGTQRATLTEMKYDLL